MSVDDKCLVVDAEVCLPHYLDLDLPKLLPHGSSGVVEIVVHIFDVDDHEFAHPFSSESGFEAILPVRRFVNFESLHSLDVDDVDELGDLVHQYHGPDASQVPRERLRQDNQIITADRGQLHIKRVLVMVSRILLLMGNQLLGVLVSADHMVVDEVDQTDAVRSVLELEVEAMGTGLLFNLDAFLLGVVLQYQLFQEQKCSFVLHFLSHLHLGLPEMRSVRFFAVVTLKVGNDEIDDESLLEISSALNFFLNGDSDLQSFAMGLGPDEGSIDQFDPLEPLDVLQAERKKLGRFWLEMHPRRSLVPVALSAMLQLNRSRNTFCDIDS